MPNALAIIRALVIYGLCLPLAIFLGYLLAMPMDLTSFTVVALAVFLPLVPVLLRWHHLGLIIAWNMNAVLVILPGRPNLWIVMAGTSLLLSVAHHVLNRDVKFLHAPSVTRPLVFLALVLLATAQLTGGVGFRVFGGEAFGGKRYILALGAIIGYFALICRPIPPERALLYVALFFLSGVTMSIASLGPMLDPSFHFIFAIFPVENLQSLMGEGMEQMTGPFSRLSGFSFGAMAALLFLLARHGMRGILSLNERWRFLPGEVRGGLKVHQPWRSLLFLLFLWISLLGGFRSALILLLLTMLCQFCFEGLFRTRLLPLAALAGILVAAGCVPMLERLPFSVQRSLSFLPLPLDPMARYSAEASNEWRLAIWRFMLPEVPKYLWLGKGYAINPAELEMTRTGGFYRTTDDRDVAILAGDYHNGPLSLLIPLGIYGFVGFIWFIAASLRVLYRNLKHGDPALRTANSFLLSYFLARTVLFFFVFGSFYGEFFLFTGLVGLSISLNGGVRGPAPVVTDAAKPVSSQLRLARAAP